MVKDGFSRLAAMDFVTDAPLKLYVPSWAQFITVQLVEYGRELWTVEWLGKKLQVEGSLAMVREVRKILKQKGPVN